jgi:hypothetical protein
MDTADMREGELIGRLRRLDARARESQPAFDYHGLLSRHDARKSRARRRLSTARGVAGALVLSMMALSAWRLDSRDPLRAVSAPVEVAAEDALPQQRLVRADNYLALAAIEDHIANIDDAISVARLSAPGADVQRLERTRAELLDSYTQVRYAQMVAANY